VTLSPAQTAWGKAALVYVLAALVLHMCLFVLLAEVWGGTVFLSLPTLGIVLGALGWRLFSQVMGPRFWWILASNYSLAAVAALALLAVGAEAAICIIIGVPMFLPGMLVGMFGMKAWLWRGVPDKTRHHVVLLGLPFLAMGVDANLAYPSAGYAVETVIEIAAPPDVVWAQTLAIPTIQPGERIWTFSHAILRAPQPISASVQGDVRQLHWTKGVRFKEIILEQEMPEMLRWRFDFDDPESLRAIDPHVSPNSRFLRLTTGEYLLEPKGDGTRLTLRTHYIVATPFNGYLGLWGEVFLQDFHSAVLSVIRSRAEAAI